MAQPAAKAVNPMTAQHNSERYMTESLCDMVSCNGIFGRKASLTGIFFQDTVESCRIMDDHSFLQTAQTSQSRGSWFCFWGLLALTAGVRLIGIGRPLLGNFATKNVVYAMIARNWADGIAGLAYPTLDCLAGGGRSLHMLEFPVSAYLTGWLWKSLGGSLDVWGRATAVAFSVAAVAVLYLFVRRRHGRTAALAAGLALALSPVSIIYGQSFMLEASLVFFMVGAFYALDRWLAPGGWGWLAAAALCLALLLLTKIYAALLLLPLGVMVWRGVRRAEEPVTRKLLRLIVVLAAAALAILPAAVWYLHAYRTSAPDGPLAERIYYSVRSSIEVHRPPHPLLWSPDFYRRLLDDLSGVVLTPVGLVLLLAGLLDRAWRQHAAWLAAAALLVGALPLKFYQMNYYYMAVLPPLCILVGLGWQVLQRRLDLSPPAVAGLLAVAVVFSCRHALGPMPVTPEADRSVVAAGQAVQALTAADEPVVTMHGSTIDLLYYCHRTGWAVAPDTPGLDALLKECRRQGARYLVVAGPEAAMRQPGRLPVPAPVVRRDGYCIYPLASVHIVTEGR